MARPQKKGLDYFPFDVDFFSDPKVLAISGEFGIKGEIVLTKLLCAIYRNGYFILWEEQAKMHLLGILPGISPDLLDSIVNRLVRWNFFDKNLFNSARVLTSRGIQRRYFEIVKRRKNSDKYPYLIINVCKNPVNVCNNSVNVYNNRESKDKQSLSYSNKKSSTPQRAYMCACEADFFAELRNSQIWLEDMCMRFHLSLPTVVEYISEFELECKCKDHIPDSISDLKSHFHDWLRIQNQKKQNQNERTANNQRGLSQTSEHLRSKLPPKPGCGLIED